MGYSKDIYEKSHGTAPGTAPAGTELAEERRRAFYALYPPGAGIEKGVVLHGYPGRESVLHGKHVRMSCPA